MMLIKKIITCPAWPRREGFTDCALTTFKGSLLQSRETGLLSGRGFQDFVARLLNEL